MDCIVFIYTYPVCIIVILQFYLKNAVYNLLSLSWISHTRARAHTFFKFSFNSEYSDFEFP